MWRPTAPEEQMGLVAFQRPLTTRIVSPFCLWQQPVVRQASKNKPTRTSEAEPRVNGNTAVVQNAAGHYPAAQYAGPHVMPLHDGHDGALDESGWAWTGLDESR